MSTALRIASVTQVLKDLLNNGLIDHDVTGSVGGNINVTSWPPDKIETATDREVSQLNLFMYQATLNHGWRNASLPAFNSKGERVSNPPLAIDLHYLLSAYGSAELHTDILLGYGMQLFHETMMLDRDSIRKAIGPPSALSGSPPATPLPASLKLLSTSDLAEQVEQIKITPEVLSIEDISKLWAAFGAKYRPTAAYKVTVVLIETDKSIKKSLPVKARSIYTKTFRQPVINKILSKDLSGTLLPEDQKILAGYELILEGNLLSDENVFVYIDGKKVSNSLTVTDTELSFDLPADLQAGIHEVQVIHPLSMGSPPALHEGVMSQTQTFILSPEITALSPPTNTSGTGNQLRSATITATVNPAIQPGQDVILMLNEIASDNAAAYSFRISASAVLSPPLPTTKISFDITGVKNASYLVRIMIDGGESPLKTDANGKYDSPQLTIP